MLAEIHGKKVVKDDPHPPRLTEYLSRHSLVVFQMFTCVVKLKSVS